MKKSHLYQGLIISIMLISTLYADDSQCVQDNLVADNKVQPSGCKGYDVVSAPSIYEYETPLFFDENVEEKMSGAPLKVLTDLDSDYVLKNIKRILAELLIKRTAHERANQESLMMRRSLREVQLNNLCPIVFDPEGKIDPASKKIQEELSKANLAAREAFKRRQ